MNSLAFVKDIIRSNPGEAIFPVKESIAIRPKLETT
jgi:hypothetical protein